MSENSHYPFGQEPPLQLPETGGGQQGDIVKNDVGVPPKSQRKNDYSQNWPHERVWDENSKHRGPSPEEEWDPFDMVRSFHRRQRELVNPSPSTPSPGIRRRRQTGNDNNTARDTPKPQREGREKQRTFQNGIRCLSVEPLDEISYIPKDSQPMAGRNFMDGNANHIDLTSYMQLPPVGQDNRICGKCGQQGHVKRYCLANVNCDFCKTKSHATLACRTYANFVKEHPLTKNTPERIRSEIDVDMEVARRVELELRKWQRERVPTGKPPIPQPRRQQEMNRDLYVDQRKYQSQDIRVQLGETVHTKLHQAQSGRYPQGANYLRLKANNQFIAEESVQDPPEEEVNYESESRQRSSPSDVELQESQRRINANNRFIAEEQVNCESESRQRSSPSDVELQESQRRINANNRFIAEEQVNCESETGQRNSASYGELQRFRRQIDANNRFIAKKERKLERMSEEQVQVNPVQYEPQRFQQTIKANNRFIARGGHSYDKLPRAAGDVVVLAEQQGSQVSIDGNNRFIDNIKGNQKDKACQQYGQSDIDDLGNFSDKVINQNIANRYQREQTGQALDMAGVSWRDGRGQVQQNPVDLSSNARGRQAELGKKSRK